LYIIFFFLQEAAVEEKGEREGLVHHFSTSNGTHELHYMNSSAGVYPWLVVAVGTTTTSTTTTTTTKAAVAEEGEQVVALKSDSGPSKNIIRGLIVAFFSIMTIIVTIYFFRMP
jgi:hypothetical protein